MPPRESGLLVLVFIWVASEWFPEWVPITTNSFLRTAGASMWLFGAVMSLWPMWQLRRSFSIEPAARELVTSGPYRLARHPIYASFLFTYIGILLLRPSVPHAIVFVVWLVLTRIRIGYEERVLLGAFPEYAAYRERVGAFGPKLGRSRPRRIGAAERVT